MPKPKVFYANIGELEIQAAEGDNKKPVINIVAYNGGKLNLRNFAYPVVMAVSGIKIPATVPFLVEHKNDVDSILGQGKVTKVNGTLVASGEATGTGAKAMTVINNASNGHTHQASIGANPVEAKFVDKGVTIQENGRSFTGPLVHVTKSELLEVSAVAIGADREGTELDIAAMFGIDNGNNGVEAPNFRRKESGMNKEMLKWIQATLGLDEEAVLALSEEQQKKIEAHYAASMEVENDDDSTEEDASGIEAKVSMLEEELRISQISAACGDGFEDLKKEAISKGWKLDTVKATLGQIEKLRDSRENAPNVMVRGANTDAKTIEASVAMAYTNLDDKALEASYGAEVMEQADKMRNATLKEIMATACHIDGVSAPSIGSDPHTWAKAAFSTRTFPTLLSNVANKTMLASYNQRQSVATAVSKKMNANDFKTHTQARAIAGGGMQKVTDGGELKHGTIEDKKYTYDIDTYGELLGLTRQDIINDDLGAFAVLPEQMGFDAWQTREELFWTLVLDNSDNFYASGNGNLLTGAGSALSITGLDAAATKFEKQTDEKGRAIALTPEIMLVPSELSATADGFYTSTNLITGEDATRTEKNVKMGKFMPYSTPFLSNSAITGYSATAWYLFANPNILPSYVIAYLNGRETPIVEETDPDPRFLGRTFRCYYDVGVAKWDPKGSVKNAGA